MYKELVWGDEALQVLDQDGLVWHATIAACAAESRQSRGILVIQE